MRVLVLQAILVVVALLSFIAGVFIMSRLLGRPLGLCDSPLVASLLLAVLAFTLSLYILAGRVRGRL